MPIYPSVLPKCGATHIFVDSQTDPTNELEFSKLKYESPSPITWEHYCQKAEEFKHQRGSKQLRIERDKLLQETDWLMTVDNFQTLENQDEWIAYRQQLRDLPSTITTYVWKVCPRELDLEQTGIPKKPEIKRKPKTQ
jgi:hypothetical protein